MILCGVICTVLLTGMAMLRKKAIWQNIRSPCLVLLTFGVMGFLAAAAEWGAKDGANLRKIPRREPGEGVLETEVYVVLEDEEETYPVLLAIEERKYRKAEEEGLLAAAIKEVNDKFCGQNLSLEQIVSNPVVCESYQEGRVLAEWSFSEKDVISPEGEINPEALKKSRQRVEAYVALNCGTSEEVYRFAFWILANPKTKKEQAILEAKEKIAAQDSTEAVVMLPDEIGGQKAAWSKPSSVQTAEILGLGILAAIAAAYAAKEQKERQMRKRKQHLLLAYPEFVSRLSLLLGAGMTISGALRNMNRMYQKRKAAGKREEAYEELEQMMFDLDNGMGEVRAFQNFSERCDLQPYRKLASLLAFGQKAGNRKLTRQLLEEADRVFAERKNMARKLGEEAGTKMLLPMMMMLMIVMAVIIIPAFLSFYG